MRYSLETDRQRSLSNGVPFLPNRYGTLKMKNDTLMSSSNYCRVVISTYSCNFILSCRLLLWVALIGTQKALIFRAHCARILPKKFGLASLAFFVSCSCGDAESWIFSSSIQSPFYMNYFYDVECHNFSGSLRSPFCELLLSRCCKLIFFGLATLPFLYQLLVLCVMQRATS